MTMDAKSFMGRVLAVFSRRSPGFRPPVKPAEMSVSTEQSAVSVSNTDGAPVTRPVTNVGVDCAEGEVEESANVRIDGHSVDGSEDFAAFYRRTVSRMYARASLLSADREEAYDLVQEVYVSLWKNWNRIGGDHKAAEARAHREMMNRLTRERRSSRWILVGDEKQLLPYIDRPSSRASPGNEVSSLERVRQALEKMPPAQRQIAVMRYLDGLDIHEIAEMLEISKGTVSVHLARARRRLSGLLNEKEPESATVLRLAETSLASSHASEENIQHDYDRVLNHILGA